MINGFIPQHYSSHQKCEVCDSVISYQNYLLSKELNYSVCQSLDCRRIMSQKSIMAAAFFELHLEFNRKIIRQRRERDAAKKKHIADITAKEDKENREVFISYLNQHPELLNQNLFQLVIPSGNTKKRLTSDIRKQNYIEFLKQIVSDASEHDNAEEVDYDEHHDAYGKRQLVDKCLDINPLLRTISDDLCCMCKGGCCASGKEHAYLSVFSMRRLMDEHAEYSTEQILELYLSRVNDEAIVDSCINHTETGCMLPRYLRSDICNGYYCDSLKTFHKEVQGNEASFEVLTIQRSHSYWKRLEPGVNNDIIGIKLLKTGEIHK
jgi:hypothetical protein